MDKIFFKKLHQDAVLPAKGSEFAAGFDLSSIENVVIKSGDRKLISTGLSCALPLGTYGRIAPRSGLAVKFGIDVLAGVVDSDYRGELKVALVNLGSEDFEVKVGDRIAQLIVEKYLDARAELAEELPQTLRGSSGFGSTGK